LPLKTVKYSVWKIIGFLGFSGAHENGVGA
jgi:hypothetical protein